MSYLLMIIIYIVILIIYKETWWMYVISLKQILENKLKK